MSLRGANQAGVRWRPNSSSLPYEHLNDLYTAKRLDCRLQTRRKCPCGCQPDREPKSIKVRSREQRRIASQHVHGILMYLAARFYTSSKYIIVLTNTAAAHIQYIRWREATNRTGGRVTTMQATSSLVPRNTHTSGGGTSRINIMIELDSTSRQVVS